MTGCASVFQSLLPFRHSRGSKRKASSSSTEWIEECKKPSHTAHAIANELEDPSWISDDYPPSYEAISNPTLYRPDIMETIENQVSLLDSELRELSLRIHDHPELAFQEEFAHDTLTAYMRSKGFKVTPRYKKMHTAWKAEWSYGVGGRVFGVNSEMDALPGIGHGCGHNLIAIAGLGVAIAAKVAMEKHKVPGKIVLLGTPAEEEGGGKVVLLEKGAYQEMDFCLMCHPAPGPSNFSELGPTLALQPLVVEYFGHPAHASYAPWEGQNALDAAILAYNNVSLLRQQIKPSCRVNAVIEGNDWVPNVIPDYAKMRWIVRAPSYAELADLVRRVKACIEAAALASSCRCETSLGVAYYDLRQNPALSQEFASITKNRYNMGSKAGEGALGASTDFGNVTYQLPAFHPVYSIPTVANGGNHTAEFEKSARTIEAHNATLTVVKGLALLGIRVLDDDRFFNRVLQTFEKGVFQKAE